MKTFLRRLLGVEALSAKFEMLKQELADMKAENERIQLKLSSLGKYDKLDMSKTQAAGIMRAIESFKARRCGGNICKR